MKAAITASIITALVFGPVGYLVRDYNQCKFEVAQFKTPILGTDD